MALKIDQLSDLIEYIYKEIQSSTKKYHQPKRKVIQDLVENLYYASMNSEEGDLIKVKVAFYNPNEISTRVQKADKVQFTNFAHPIKLDIKAIVKLSKSADPWSSTLAIFSDSDDELWINGLLDQAIHAESYLNRETSIRPPQVGLFQISITGIGSLSVTKDYELIATYKQNVLVTTFLDVLKNGPIAKLLQSKANTFRQYIRDHVRKNYKGMGDEDYDFDVNNAWRDSISRLLIQVRRYGHGGAILITNNHQAIVPKYKICYSRLNSAMLEMIKLRIEYDSIVEKIEANPGKPIKSDFFDKYVINAAKTKSSDNEIKGAIRFIAAHSCVDGLVLLDNDLNEIGYGAVVPSINPPKITYQAYDSPGSTSKLQERPSSNFGTRHQSMMTFCAQNIGSIGFVISQDGDIRAFTQIEDKLLMWENIKTHKYLKTPRFSLPVPKTRESR